MALMTVYYFWSFKAILLLRLVNWFLCIFDLRVSVFPKWSWLVGQQFGQNGQNWIRLQNHFGDKTVEGTWNKPHFRAVGEGGVSPQKPWVCIMPCCLVSSRNHYCRFQRQGKPPALQRYLQEPLFIVKSFFSRRVVFWVIRIIIR